MALQQGQRDPPHEGQVFGRLTLCRAVLVLRERYGHLPVEVVLDAPMIAQAAAVEAGPGLLAADEIADLATGLPRHGALALTHANHRQLGPIRFLADSLGVPDDDVTPSFLPAVSPFGLRVDLKVATVDPVVQRPAQTP